MACDIILLKISFENSINLGGKNIHLDSKLEDPIPWPIGLSRLATMVVVVEGSGRLKRMVVVLWFSNPNLHILIARNPRPEPTVVDATNPPVAVAPATGVLSDLLTPFVWWLLGRRVVRSSTWVWLPCELVMPAVRRRSSTLRSLSLSRVGGRWGGLSETQWNQTPLVRDCSLKKKGGLGPFCPFSLFFLVAYPFN